MTIDPSIAQWLDLVNEQAQKHIDKLMVDRQNASSGDKQKLSYITKKIDLISKTCDLCLIKLENSK